MSDDARRPMSTDARTALDRYVANHGMPRPLQEHVWRRIASDIAAGDGRPAEAITAAARRSGGQRRWGLALVAMAVALGALWWTGVLESRETVQTRGAAHQQASDHPALERAQGEAELRAPAERTHVRDAQTQTRDGAPGPERDAPRSSVANASRTHGTPDVDETPDADAAPVTDAPRHAVDHSSAPDAAARPAAPRPDLSAELELLTRAQSALAKGRSAEAQELVAQHRRTFPRSTLAQERDALDLLAACHVAPSSDALARKAKAFGRRYPGSPQLPRIQESCLP